MPDRYLQAPIREDLDRTDEWSSWQDHAKWARRRSRNASLAGCAHGTYLNWDRRDDRRDVRAARWPAGRALVVLDELHKWRGWKRWLKGEFDARVGDTRFLITGSARLDVYRQEWRLAAGPLSPLSVAPLLARRS